MLGINLTQGQRKAMAKKHTKYMLAMVKIRLARPQNNFLTSYFSSDKLIKEVLETEPDLLLALNKKVWDFLAARYAGADIRAALQRTFSEAHFFNKATPKYNAYHLCESIGLKTCPYCNILFISTVMPGRPKKLVTRPPLDHFYANTLFPLLAISFYNLIPSCDKCNSRFKLASPIHHLTHLNPYAGEFGDDCAFQLRGFRKIDDILAPKGKDFSIRLKNMTGDDRFDGNEELFHLNDMYSMHRFEARNCLIKSVNFSQATIESMAKIAGKTGTDTYSLLFEGRLDLHNLHLSPLSKLKRDIVLKYASAALKMELGL